MTGEGFCTSWIREMTELSLRIPPWLLAVAGVPERGSARFKERRIWPLAVEESIWVTQETTASKVRSAERCAWRPTHAIQFR